MADTGRTVFADGFFPDDFWAAGFWASGDAAPVDTTPTPAGKGRKRHPHKYFVQIDGQDFEVRSQQEAVDLLEQAAAIAERAAEQQVQQQARAVPKALKVAPIAPVVPKISTNAPIDLSPYRRAIERAYRSAAAAAEIRLLLEAKAREEDEAVAILLLH
jgi:hypothetical protein